MFGYYVTRQAYYYSECAVEIAPGETIDVTGCDTLMERWPELGEGTKFINPRDAVKAAIKISRAWNKPIAINNWRGWGGEGEVIESPFDLLLWVHQQEERMVRCDRCGNTVHEENAHYLSEFDSIFCSEYCAESAWDEDYDEEEVEDWMYDDDIPF